MTAVISCDRLDALTEAFGQLNGQLNGQTTGERRGHILGGGTLLMRQVNYAPQTIATLVLITDPLLKQITAQGDRILIGAGVTMADVIAAPDLAALAPCARGVGGPAIRNMATVGGNLFAPSPYGDFAAALLAVGAHVLWADGRRQEIEAFFRSRESETGCVSAVSVPRLRAEEVRFRKVSRVKPKGVSVLSITAYLQTMGSRVEAARIAFGAMGKTPLRAKAAENALRGAALDASGVAAACAVCTQDLEPLTDALASDWYRREVAPVYLRRLLLGEA